MRLVSDFHINQMMVVVAMPVVGKLGGRGCHRHHHKECLDTKGKLYFLKVSVIFAFDDPQNKYCQTFE